MADSAQRSYALFACTMGVAFLVCGVVGYAADSLLLAAFFGVTGVVMAAFGVQRLFARKYSDVTNPTSNHTGDRTE